MASILWFTFVNMLMTMSLDLASGYIQDDRYYVVEFNPFLNQETAKMFATSIRHKRQVDCTVVTVNACTNEHFCECNKADCQSESDREYYFSSPHNTCTAEEMFYLTVPCPAHFAFGCAAGIDVVFLLDESISQGEDGFQRQKNYVSDFISRSPVDSSYTRVALVTYSFSASIRFTLNTTFNTTDLQQRVSSLNGSFGVSRLNQGLKAARESLFTTSGGMRSNSNKYVVVLSDGLSSETVETLVEGQLLRQAGINIVAVGIGSQVWHQELLLLTNDHTKVFPSITDDAFHFINYHFTVPRCTVCDQKRSDVAFVIDASTDVSIKDFYEQQNTMRVLAKYSPVSTNGVRISYTRYGERLYEEFDFDEHLTSDDVVVALSRPERLNSVKGPANATNALVHFQNGGFSNASINTRKFIVLFTNGNFHDFDNVVQVADDLKNANIFIAAVGTGNTVNMTSLLQVASDPAFVYLIGDDVHTDISAIYTLISSFEFYDCIPNECIW